MLLSTKPTKGPFLHERYNPGSKVQAISCRICAQIRRRQSIQEVQQDKVLYVVGTPPPSSAVPNIHNHPNQYTYDEIKLLKDKCRRNSKLDRAELWCRLRQHGYTWSHSGFCRILHLHKLHPRPKPRKKVYKPKHYQQKTFPSEWVQIDVKLVPGACKAGEATDGQLARHTTINEYSRLCCLKA